MEKELILDYQNGCTFEKLSKKYNISKYKIKKILVDNNIHIRIGRERIPFTREQIEDIIYMYNNHNGINLICKKYNTDYTTIKKVLEDNKIEKTQWRKINKRIIDNFFESIENEQQAYLLGLFYTDGYVKNSGTIGIFLQESDLEMIEKIKNILQIDGQIQFDKRMGKEGCGIEFTSQKMKEDLSKYGIVPNKTYTTIGLPNNIPKHLLNHFFRGLFDGDGIFHYKDGDSQIGFCSYYFQTVKDFQNHIDLIIEKKNSNKITKENAYRCSWRGSQQILSILNYLYNDSTIYLERKYLKYLKLKIT